MEVSDSKRSGCEHHHRLEQLKSLFPATRSWTAEAHRCEVSLDATATQRRSYGNGRSSYAFQGGRHGNEKSDESEASISDVLDGHGAIRRSERFVCGRW